jgi:hypothetical protein
VRNGELTCARNRRSQPVTPGKKVPADVRRPDQSSWLSKAFPTSTWRGELSYWYCYLSCYLSSIPVICTCTRNRTRTFAGPSSLVDLGPRPLPPLLMLIFPVSGNTCTCRRGGMIAAHPFPRDVRLASSTPPLLLHSSSISHPFQLQMGRLTTAASHFPPVETRERHAGSNVPSIITNWWQTMSSILSSSSTALSFGSPWLANLSIYLRQNLPSTYPPQYHQYRQYHQYHHHYGLSHPLFTSHLLIPRPSRV